MHMPNLHALLMENNKITKINSNAFSDNKKMCGIDLSGNLIKILNLQFIYNINGFKDNHYYISFNNNLIEDFLAIDNGTFVEKNELSKFVLNLRGNLLSQVDNMINQKK